MEQQFQPLLKPEFVQNAITLYKKDPRSFNDDFVNQIQTHAEYYQIPFEKDWKDEDFRLLDTIQQAGKGFLEGFTTLKMGEEPKTTSERIARSAGHLAGFVGYVPAVGPKVVKGVAQMLRGNSLPMYVANKLTDPTKRITGRLVDSALKGRSGAAKDAYKFLNKDVVKSTTEGAFHLGAASAVSAWQGGIDEMAHGFFGGAVAGGAFRLIGEYVRFAKPPTGEQIAPNGQPIWKKLDSAQRSDMMLRATAGAMFTGLPSTMRGDTTPEQVYEYLLGGYFGFREMPAVEHFANKFMNKVSEKSRVEKLPLPEDIKGWKDLSPETQARVKERIDSHLGENYQLEALLNKFGKEVQRNMKEQGIKPEEALENMPVNKMSEKEGDGKYTLNEVEAVTGQEHPEKIRQKVEEGKEINKEAVKDVEKEASFSDNAYRQFLKDGKLSNQNLDKFAEKLHKGEIKEPTKEEVEIFKVHGEDLNKRIEKLSLEDATVIDESKPLPKEKPEEVLIDTELKLKKVISGAQDGADITGVKWAKEKGFETGGTAPKGFYTHKESLIKNRPEYKDLYNIQEVSDATTKAYTGREYRYGPRTEKNILDSDGTLVFASDVNSLGTKGTRNKAKLHNKPYLENPTPQELNKWLKDNKIETLNIAGNRNINEQSLKNLLDNAIFKEKPKEEYQKVDSSKVALLSEEPRLAVKIIDKLKETYPEINSKALEKVYAENGQEVAGRALGSLVEWSTSKGKLDTPPHEYSHIYLNLLEQTPIVKRAITDLTKTGMSVSEAKEVLADSMGKGYVELIQGKSINKVTYWAKKIWGYLKDVFSGKNIGGVVEKARMDRLIHNFYEGKNRDAIRFSPKEGFVKVDLESALKENPHAKAILKKLMKEKGEFILTGSSALSKQGEIYRADNNLFHDIDLVTKTTAKEGEKLLYKHYPDAKKIKDFRVPSQRGDSELFKNIKTYIIPRENTEIANIKHEGRIMTAYDAVDKKTGAIVGTYRIIPKKSKGKTVGVLKEKTEGESGLLLDLFDNSSLELPPMLYKSKELGVTIGLKNAHDIFEAKWNIGKELYSRDKDVIDSNTFYGTKDLNKEFLQKEQEKEQRKRPIEDPTKDNDPVEVSEVDFSSPVPQTYLSWVERNAKPLITDTKENIRLDKWNKVSKEVYDKFENFMKDYTPEKEMDILYKDLSSMNISMNDEGRSFWRGKVRQQHYGALRNIVVANVETDTAKPPWVEFIKPGRMNLAGNEMKVPEAINFIEQIYTNNMKSKGLKVDEKSRSMADFTHFVKRSIDGQFKDMSLADYRNSLHPKVRDFEFNRAVGDVINQMHNQGFYYFGGKGASEVMKFMKYHPDTPKELTKDNVWTRIYFKKLEDAKIKSAEKLHNYSREQWKKRYGKESGKLYDRAFVSNILYDLEYNGFAPNVNNMSVMLNKNNNFINNVVNFNKRMQIMATGATPAERKYVNDILQGEDYNIALVEALSDRTSVKKLAKKMNMHMAQITDGAVFTRQDILGRQLIDMGAPKSMDGELKTFIVEPSQMEGAGKDAKPLGAMLGKYMQHRASDALNKEMMDKNIHHIVYTSSAKQYGTRKPVYAWWDKGLKFGKHSSGTDIKGVIDPSLLKDGKFLGYKLKPEAFKYVSSETSTNHNIAPQRLVKQMWTPLSYFSKEPTNFEHFADLFKTTIDAEFKGSSEVNKNAMKILSDPENLVVQNKIIKNIEDIGFIELNNIINNPRLKDLSGKIIQKILTLKNKNISEMYEEGELTQGELNSLRAEAKEHNTIAERLIDIYKGELSIMLDKDVSPYVRKAMDNFLIQRLTKPRWKNAVTGRMKPYTFEMLNDKKFSKLNKEEDIYLLDNNMKEKEFDLNLYNSLAKPEEALSFPNNSKTKFGEIVEVLESKDTSSLVKDNINRFIESVGLRVPMDSASGAQVLRFGGFTGNKGYGIYLHANKMEALGGADLDGDKAWLFFGFKKGWKDLYKKQKDEFTDVNGNYMPSKSKENEHLWTIPPSKQETAFAKESGLKKIEDHPLLKYSPYYRIKASEGAYMGRKQLGLSVVGGQVATATYNALSKHPMGTWFDAKSGLYIKVRKSPKEQEEIRRRLRDSISYPADAPNYSALADPNSFRNNLYFSMFETGRFKTNKDGSIKNTIPFNFKEASDFKLYKKLLRDFPIDDMYRSVNQALYGRNYKLQRNWTFGERLEKLKSLEQVDSEVHKDNVLYNIGKRAKQINMEDGLIKRVIPDVVERHYNEFNERVKRLGKLRDALGRSSLITSYKSERKGSPLKAVLDNRLWDPVSRSHLASSKEIFNNFIQEYGLTEYGKIPKWRGSDSAKNYLERLYNKSNDFLGNDIKLQSAVEEIYKHITKHKISDDIVSKYSKDVERLKVNAWLRAKENSREFEHTIQVGDQTIPITKESYENIKNKLSPKEFLKLNFQPASKEKVSSKLSQEQIDWEIDVLKKRTDVQAEKDLIDLLILSPAQRGARIEHLEKLLSQEIKDNDLISEILQESAKTNTSRIGLYSKSVEPKNVKRFYGTYVQKMKDLMTPLKVIDKEAADKHAESVVNKGVDVEGSDKKIPFFDEIVWSRELRDSKGFKEFNPEMQKIHDRILSEMRKRPTTVGTNLNGIVRNMFEKDISDMNLRDWKALTRWFDDIQGGTFMDKFIEVPEGRLDKIPKLFHWMFPETIARKSIKSDFQLLKQQGLFNKDGHPAEGTTHKPTSTYGKIYHYIKENYHLSQKRQDEEEARIRKHFDYLYSFKEGLKLYEIMTWYKEHPLVSESPSYIIPKNIKAEYKKLKDKEFTYLKNIDGKEQKFTKKGSEIIKDLHESVTGLAKNSFFKQISENEGAISKYRNPTFSLEESTSKALKEIVDSYEVADAKGKKRIIAQLKNNPYLTQNLYNHKKIFAETFKELYEGKFPKIIEEFGIDGLNRIANDIKVSQTENIILKAKLRSILPKKTPHRPFDSWIPHRDHPKAEVEKVVKKHIEDVRKDTTLSPEEKAQKLIKFYMKLKNSSVELDFVEGRDWMDYDNLVREGLLSKTAEKEFVPDNIIQGTRHQMERMAHVKGYNRTPEAFINYHKELIDTQHKQLSQIVGRALINDFKNKQNLKAFNKKGDMVDVERYKITQAWTNMFKMYLNEATGMPSVIPKNVYEDPYFNVKGTPYAWFADNRVKNKINKVSEFLGLRKDEISKLMKNVDEGDLHRWSNLEARYELATLLAHPKSAIANVFGGTTLSVMSAGYNNYKKVRDYDWIRRNISDKLDSKEKQDAFARKHGIIEEMLLNEANLAKFTNKEFKKEAWDSIMADITNRVRKGENPDNRTVIEILKQHGVDKNILSKAAYFMTVSERMLRRDSFMTHYIQAFRKFQGVLGPENIDHPWLIAQAKKGVKATQFMYAAPYRPAFTRTALGKVYSRFQLWAWNSVGFRNRVHREAKLYDYTPGTPEFERFKRTAMADLFVLGLANVFTYSLFESALPAPMNWFQDTAEWIFGDENERDRAFFGQYPTPIAPLQAISPPIMRFPAAMFTAMVDDDWSRVGNYYAWTMFPFGRMARDVKGVFENPMMMLEKSTGFPLIKLNKQVKEYQDEDMLYHRVFPRTPPNIE